MKKHSFSILAALLVVFPAMLNAQEYDVPQTPPAVDPETVVVPETVVAPETVAAPEVTVQDETVAEAPAEEVKAKKEKKVKEKKVKEPKAPKVKEVREEKKEKSYGLFNHLGAGVYGGVMEGLGATVAVPIGGHLQIRGTYSVGVPDKVYALQYTVPDMGSHDINGKTVDLKDILVKGIIPSDAAGYVDLYFSKKGSFHLTIGMAGLLAGNNYLGATADISKQLKQAFPNDDPSTLFVKFEDESTGKKAEIAPDKDGILHLDIKSKSALRPYFGIGWGRVCNIHSWLSLSLDLGVQKVDGLSITGYDSKGKEQQITSGMLDHKDSFDVPVVGKIDDLLDKAAAGELPYLKGFMPVVKIGVQVRLF